MSTGTFLVQRALQRIGAHSVVSPASPESLDEGFIYLTGLLELWESKNIQIGTTPIAAIGDEINEPIDTRSAIINNLALELAPSFDNGKTIVSQNLRDAAQRDFITVKNLYQDLSIPPKIFSSTLPAGQGNQFRSFGGAQIAIGGFTGGSTGGILPIAGGGTNADNAPTALANLGALPVAGGAMTGNITLGSTLTDGASSVGTSGQALTSTVTGVAWSTIAGSGDVIKVGTPVDNQLGIWTGDGTIEGDAALTFDTTTDSLAIGASGNLLFGAVTILDDAAGVMTLQNIDALDATTESTIEAAIDTLANLTAAAALVTVGSLNSGSITSGFGAIDIGSSALDTTGLGTLGSLRVTGTFADSSGDVGTSGQVLTSTVTGTNWTTAAGGGDVSKVGTPVDNQIGVWTGDGTIEGDTSLTFDTSSDTLAIGASGNLAFGAVTILDDASGTMTLQNIDALDATTESTIESAIDTLSNLTAATALVSVGALDSGSITSNFGSINIGSSALATTGTITGPSGTWDSGGMDIAASDSYAVNGTDILSDSAGTMTLSNVDALDATTEATIEAAIDTLANLTSATALVSVGALNSGSITSGFGSIDIGASALDTTGLGTLGSLRVTGTFADTSGDVGTSGQILSSTVTGTNWIDAAGGGNVNNTGTPLNNQLAVWTDATTVEGDTALTFDTTTDSLAIAASGNLLFGAVTILDDAAGTMTLQNIDALDATTESTIEAAIDTLANLTSATSLTSIGTLTSLTMGGTISCADNIVDQPLIRDYAIESTSPTISAGTLTLDMVNGNDFDVTWNANITTLTISSWPASGTLGKITLRLAMDGTTRTIAYPGAINWPGGVVPTAPAINQDIEYVFWSRDAGTTIQGAEIGKAFA